MATSQDSGGEPGQSQWLNAVHQTRMRAAEITSHYEARAERPRVALRDGDFGDRRAEALKPLAEAATAAVWEFWSLLEPHSEDIEQWNAVELGTVQVPRFKATQQGRPMGDRGRETQLGRVHLTPATGPGVTVTYDEETVVGLDQLEANWHHRDLQTPAGTERLWMPPALAQSAYQALNRCVTALGWAADVNKREEVIDPEPF